MLNIFSFLGWCRLSDILVTHAQNMFPSRAVPSLLLSLCLALLRFFRFETLLQACRETHGKVVHMNILEILQFTQSICQKVYIMRRWGERVRFVYRGCWVKKIKKICVCMAWGKRWRPLWISSLSYTEKCRATDVGLMLHAIRNEMPNSNLNFIGKLLASALLHWVADGLGIFVVSRCSTRWVGRIPHVSGIIYFLILRERESDDEM